MQRCRILGTKRRCKSECRKTVDTAGIDRTYLRIAT